MKLVTCEQMREIDRRSIAEFEIPGDALMDRAGYEIAESVRFLSRLSGLDDPLVRLFAGRGNNGGDAFAAAAYLHEQNLDPEVWIAGEAAAIGGDALKHFSRMKTAGVSWRELPTKRDWEDVMAVDPPYAGLLVDGVLGTGSTGPARGPAAGAIAAINALSARAPVIAIDIPSGLNGDTGEAPGDVVKADLTLTLALPKRGLVEARALEWVGSLDVVDIGIPTELTRNLEGDLELITAEDVRRWLPRRSRTAHKGTLGHVLVVAGAPGFAGAAALSARGALRSGVGLVSVLAPASVAAVVAGLVPEAMIHAGAQTGDGTLAGDALDRWGRALNTFDAILIGPGLTPGDDTRRLLEKLVRDVRVPVVADADAINVCAGHPELLAAAAPVILTPHPGELARLMGAAVETVQSDRRGWAARCAERTGGVVVLKGAGTLVARHGQPMNVCMRGNPGMATAGMGDVLAGVVAGLAAQGIAPFDAARAAVYVHGRAGDIVAWRFSQAGMVAGDLIDEISLVWRDICAR